MKMVSENQFMNVDRGSVSIFDEYIKLYFNYTIFKKNLKSGVIDIATTLKWDKSLSPSHETPLIG